jgi:hypothetical protein
MIWSTAVRIPKLQASWELVVRYWPLNLGGRVAVIHWIVERVSERDGEKLSRRESSKSVKYP